MVMAEIRVALHVIEEIIHPAHIPLEVKAESSVILIAGNLRPCRGFLRDQDCALCVPCKDGIQVFQEFHRLQVLISAVHVRDPLARVLSIIKIQHGCHSVHPDPVGVKLLRPV